MHGLVLLGAAVAFLALTKRPTEPAATTTASQIPNADPLEPTFDSVPIPPKTKQTSTTLAEEQTAAAPVAQISPPAPGSMPPYVYDQIPDFGSAGATESGTLMF